MTTSTNTSGLPRTLTYSFPQVYSEMLPGHEPVALRLQARCRWFEPTCAHQVCAARLPFMNTNLRSGEPQPGTTGVCAPTTRTKHARTRANRAPARHCACLPSALPPDRDKRRLGAPRVHGVATKSPVPALSRTLTAERDRSAGDSRACNRRPVLPEFPAYWLAVTRRSGRSVAPRPLAVAAGPGSGPPG